MQTEYHARKRVILLCILTLLACTTAGIMLAGVTAAQELPDQDQFDDTGDGDGTGDGTGDSDGDGDVESVEISQQLGDVTIHEVEFEAQPGDQTRAYVHVTSQTSNSITLLDAGQLTETVRGGGVSQPNHDTFDLEAGERTTIQFDVYDRHEALSMTANNQIAIASGQTFNILASLLVETSTAYLIAAASITMGFVLGIIDYSARKAEVKITGTTGSSTQNTGGA